MHWGVDEPSSDAAWPRSTGAMAGTARRVVELAAHIIMEMPDDDEAGVSPAKEAARRWLDSQRASAAAVIV